MKTKLWILALGALALVAVTGCTDSSKACEAFKKMQIKCAGSLSFALGDSNKDASVAKVGELSEGASFHDRCKEDEELRDKIHECNDYVNCEDFAECLVKLVPK